MTVNDVWRYCEMMLSDKWGYIWGTAGVMWTAEKQRNLEQKYSADDPNYGMGVRYGSKWLGHMVADCSGVPVYIWKQFGLKIPHGSTSMVTQGYIVDCSSVPQPGYAALVDPTPETPDNKHIGIVDETGKYVYEAKGTQAGFVKTAIGKSNFNKFGRFKQVEYVTNGGCDDSMGDPLYTAEVTTKNGKLNVRSGAGTSYAIIGQLDKGDKVGVYGISNGWAKISYYGEDGFVSNQYLTPIEEKPKEEKYCVIIECQSEVDAVLVASLFKTATVVRGGLS